MQIASLGYPATGMADAVALWRAGAIDDWRLNMMARTARQAGWSAQKAAGVDVIPSGEVGFGDPMAEMAALVGAVPAGFGPDIGRAKLPVRLAMAFGSDGQTPPTAPWAGTHKHYVTPVLQDDDRWRLNGAHPVAEQLEARTFGITSRPVLIGPISFLLHCQTTDGSSPLSYIDRVLPAYREVLTQFAIHGAHWVQLDEPALAGCDDDTVLQEFARVYEQLRAPGPAAKLMVATYGGSVEAALSVLAAAPIDGLHIDLVSAPGQLGSVAATWPKDRALSVGVVDALSPNPTNLSAALRLVQSAVDGFGPSDLQIAPSMPLSLAPVNLAGAPLDLAPAVETAADKLYALRRIADAVITETSLAEDAPALPQRRDLEPAALAG